MCNTDYKSLQNMYKPAVVRILFIGESPPSSGKYFYAANSKVFYSMEKALGKRTRKRGEEFLQVFKNRGLYLTDLVPFPINHLPDEDRFKLRFEHRQRLAYEIMEINPERIICFMKAINDDVENALKLSGLAHSVDLKFLPFPYGQHNEMRFRQGITNMRVWDGTYHAPRKF